ncbi:MAG: WYL domain-containing protein [Alloprevotella sp.]|nr:WYL domain-containing protein [Alloprevotella sp.]
MKISLIFRQYAWIVNALRRYGPMTLEELSRHWVVEEVSMGNPLSRTTFNRHRDAVLDMFGIIIDCDASNGYRYYIANPSALQEDSLSRWMLTALTMGGVLQDSLTLSDRLQMENVPAGDEYLEPIIKAMKVGHRLQLTYRRFGKEATTTMVSPYTLKLFRQRWYLLADTGQHLLTYALDRVERIDWTDDTFVVPDDFSAEAYFADYYGIYTKDVPMETVVLRAYGEVADYLRTLPLHESQVELPHTSDASVDFQLRLRPTYDFVQALLTMSQDVEVVQPASLRQTMKKWLRKASKYYR